MNRSDLKHRHLTCKYVVRHSDIKIGQVDKAGDVRSAENEANNANIALVWPRTGLSVYG